MFHISNLTIFVAEFSKIAFTVETWTFNEKHVHSSLLDLDRHVTDRLRIECFTRQYDKQLQANNLVGD